MIIYTVTIHIEKDVEKKWLLWMKKEHIPEIMNLEIFNKNKMFKILHPHENMQQNYKSYCIQYYCESIDHYNLYQNKYAKKLQKNHSIKYANKFKASREILEEL